MLPLLSGDLEGEPQNSNRPVDVAGLIQVQAYPARLRQDVVWLGLTRCHKLVANALGQRDVHERIAVDVSDLATAEFELYASEPVRSIRDALPVSQFRQNTLTCSRNRHGFLLPSSIMGTFALNGSRRQGRVTRSAF